MQEHKFNNNLKKLDLRLKNLDSNTDQSFTQLTKEVERLKMDITESIDSKFDRIW